MKRCPVCNSWSVAYDPYRKVDKCMNTGCSCIIDDESTYSYLEQGPNAGIVHRVKASSGEVLKEYKVA